MFRILETDAETEARIAKWDKYLETEEEKKEEEIAKDELRKESKQDERPVITEKTGLPETTAKTLEKSETTQFTNIAKYAKTLENTKRSEISLNSGNSQEAIKNIE